MSLLNKEATGDGAGAGAGDSSSSNTSGQRRFEESPSLSKRRKDLFGDCALVEIIHLHDCLRGALRALERDVEALNLTLLRGDRNTSQLNELECRVNGRFKVIWSVFRAHSSAEDEFIWPALQLKTQGLVKGSPSYRPDQHHNHHSHSHSHHHSHSHSTSSKHSSSDPPQDDIVISSGGGGGGGGGAEQQQQQQQQQQQHQRSKLPPPRSSHVVVVEDDTQMDQEAYEEDHADEERMFSNMDDLLTKLREGLLFQTTTTTTSTTMSTGSVSANEGNAPVATTLTTTTSNNNNNGNKNNNKKAIRSVDEIMKSVHELTQTLSQHLMAHLEKEEKQCMPLVVKHLSKSEIHELVGKIMGKRSSDMISEIMTMAVQNLNQSDRLEMVKYMKQAMAGTFFDKWLSMSGWMEDVKSDSHSNSNASSSSTTTITGSAEGKSETDQEEDRKRAAGSTTNPENDSAASKRTKLGFPPPVPNLSVTNSAASTENPSTMLSASAAAAHAPTDSTTTPTTAAKEEGERELSSASSILKYRAGEITSQAELEKLIRAIATNPTLTPQQKNTTIQGLRDSVWKSNQRLKQESSGVLPTATLVARAYASTDIGSAAVSVTCVPARRVTPPSIYYKKNSNGKLAVAWDADKPTQKADGQVPLFSASELAPSYHDGATGAVLGCPHYARACKLRHPVSGRLYTCRLCCEQEREMPSKDQDEPLDRYAVSEIMCMKCNALQPAEDRCINPNCESDGKPFAKYFCRICHLYDDRPRPIFHCPYCNTCRMGLGLGIDFRHCMRCNACVSLEDHEHRCIPQKLQGSCPICHESLFQSTEPLRGLKCGHVMHMSCFTNYRRGQSYNCPLCMKSMEDMSDYFALLDAAVRMQPMPYAYLSTMSNVYCQDCEKTGQCRYHFVGQKCPNCGSYNTRELGRVQATDASS